MIVVGGLGPVGLAAVGAGDPVGEGVGPHVPLQQRAQREPAPTQLTLKQQSIFSSVANLAYQQQQQSAPLFHSQQQPAPSYQQQQPSPLYQEQTYPHQQPGTRGYLH